MASDQNRLLLVAMARALGPLRQELVFVGGCATGLLVTDPAAPPVRVTTDVDAIAAMTSAAGYRALGKKLEKLGFTQSAARGDPPFRWRHGSMKLDLMPTDKAILGFASRWYEVAFAGADCMTIADGIEINVISPVHFLATKLEAFRDRGHGDYLASHDFEDFMTVIDGRPGILEEIRGAEPDLRDYIAAEIGSLLNEERFLSALPGLIADGSPPQRTRIVHDRLVALSELS